MRRYLLSRLGIVTAVLALTLPTGAARADSGSEYTTSACWQRFPMPAAPYISRMAHAGDGSIWAVLSYGPGLIQVGRFNGTGWTTFPGITPWDLAVTPSGQPWVTNGANIYRLVGTTWQQVPGQAVSIDIGQFGDIWKTGPERIDFGYSLYQWTGSDWWPIEVPRPYTAGNVTVDRNGTPWITNYEKIYIRKRGIGGGSWLEVDDGGRQTWDLDIGGHDNPVLGEQMWRIIWNTPLVDYPIQRWSSTSGWVFVEGAGQRVSVDREGRAWHVNSHNDVYFWGCA